MLVTSSVSSVIHPAPDGYGYTEDDWNEYDVKEVEEKGNQASPVTMYNASKVLAERAAWKFVEENKGKIGFDLVTILPSFVLGVSIIKVRFDIYSLIRNFHSLPFIKSKTCPLSILLSRSSGNTSSLTRRQSLLRRRHSSPRQVVISMFGMSLKPMSKVSCMRKQAGSVLSSALAPSTGKSSVRTF